MSKKVKKFFTVAEGLDRLSEAYASGTLTEKQVKKFLLYLAATRGRIELSATVGVPPAHWAKLVGTEDAIASAANILFEKENYDDKHKDGKVSAQG